MGFLAFVGKKLIWAIFGIICFIAGIIALIILDEFINVKLWVFGLIVVYIFLRCCWEDYEKTQKYRKSYGGKRK